MMAQLRVRIVNFDQLEKNLPKLRRSLSIQENVELADDPEEDGAFFLVLNQSINLNNLRNIRKLLDAYGFEFFYPEESPPPPKNWMEGCTCDACKAAQFDWKKIIDQIKESRKKELAARRR